MIPYFLLSLFAIGLGALAVYRFRLAVQLLILLLPTYLVRLKIGPLPTTLLEVALGVILLVWLVRFARQDFPKLKKFFCGHKIFTAALVVFLLASLSGVFRSDMFVPSLGQWRAYFLEPILLFVVLVGRREEISTTDLVRALGLSTVGVAMFGIFQQFSGVHLPTDDGQIISDRVTSFFSSPNAVGLFVVPILMLMLPTVTGLIKKTSKDKREKILLASYGFVYAINIVTLLLSKSLGSLVALFTGTIIYLFFAGWKKLAVVFLVLPILLAAILAVPDRAVLMTKVRSGGNRLTLWGYSWQYLSRSPDNFILGAGLRQFFRKIQKPHYDPKKMERLIYPHNIFLNFWTETGLFGLLGFAGIFSYLVYVSVKLRKSKRVIATSFLAVLGVILIHGMVDVPYFKNDLSMLFWIIAGIIINTHKSEARISKSETIPNDRN